VLALIAATSNDGAVRLRAIRQGLRHYAFLFKIWERLGMLPNLGPASPGWGREFAQGFLRWCGQQGVGGKPLPGRCHSSLRGLLNDYLATLGEEPA
jgi:hypothetical protein